MTAYVDTSVLVAITFGEPSAKFWAARLLHYEVLFSSNMLEAELRATLAREDVSQDNGGILAWVNWVYPDRPLTAEFRRILRTGYLRGADLWHLACALYLARDLPGIAFLTLDKRQGELAAELGLAV